MVVAAVGGAVGGDRAEAAAVGPDGGGQFGIINRAIAFGHIGPEVAQVGHIGIDFRRRQVQGAVFEEFAHERFAAIAHPVAGLGRQIGPVRRGGNAVGLDIEPEAAIAILPQGQGAVGVGIAHQRARCEVVEAVRFGDVLDVEVAAEDQLNARRLEFLAQWVRIFEDIAFSEDVVPLIG